jgi:aspartate/methionine/tyrosine aminotransferase
VLQRRLRGRGAAVVLEVASERVLAFVSLSKRSGMTGYRSAMMAGRPGLISALKKLRPSIGAASPGFVSEAPPPPGTTTST